MLTQRTASPFVSTTYAWAGWGAIRCRIDGILNNFSTGKKTNPKETQMPELPEILNRAREMKAALTGKTITVIEVL
ncbi:MAG: hypothetical protein PVG14_16275 [Anaerolineales bacterium]